MPNQAKRTGWNKQLHDIREATGLSVNEAVFEAWNHLPKGISRKAPKMLERYEKDWAEDKADPIFLAALALVYGKPLSELSVLAAERMAAVGVLSGPGGTWDSRCYSKSAGHGRSMVAA